MANPSTLPRVARILAVLVAAAAAGALASRGGVPLAWVLGPMVVTAAASIAGWPFFASKRGRRFGQLLVGSSIGLNVTAAALGLIVQWFPAMLTTAIVAILLAALLSVPFARAARIDPTTAFFALTPGGLAEMANVGQVAGARPEPVALSQAIRVALLVSIMPPLILAFGVDGGIPSVSLADDLSIREMAILFAGAVAGVALLTLMRANNAWMVGALVASGTLAGLGIVSGHMPAPLFMLGQFLIGIAIGGNFRRESLLRLPRVAVMVVVFIALLTLLLFGYAVLLWLATGIDLSSTALASSPGGLAEMSLTAQVLHLNVALVTAFHITRSFIVNSFTLQIFRLLERIGLFRAVGRVVDRSAGP
jgi:membrane AbrB-like protein